MIVNQIMGIVLACIVSAGGVGGIIIAIVKFSSNLIADKLTTKYENKMQKELEKYKSEIKKREYVSKTRFDAEFRIYRELSHAFFEMVKDISIMIPPGVSYSPADVEDRKKYEDECYSDARNSVVKAQDVLYSNAPFIPKEFFIGFEQIMKLCKQQLDAFAKRYNVSYSGLPEEKRVLDDKDYGRTGMINDMWMKHIDSIREYLSTLDVM